MPVGYLVTVTLVAVGTLLCLAPPRRPRALARLSWLVSIVVNELPVPVACCLIASTGLAASEGDLDAPAARVVAGFAALSVAGLAVLAWRGLRAAAAVGQALAEGLGAGWRTTVDPRPAARLRRHRPFARILLMPLRVRRLDVARIANLSYGEAGKRNRLDVYRPRTRPVTGPTLIYLHGGGYYSGRKNREARALLYWLAHQGWVCLSANYRLRPAATFTDHLIDTKKVIAWVRQHGAGYGADPALIFAAGSSAGAHLAALAALTPNDPRFQPGFPDTDTSVAAAICLYGYHGHYYGHDDTTASPSTCPADHARPDAPPFLIVHGDQDTSVPVQTARHFTHRLRTTSANPVVYAELPGAQHSFDGFASLRFEAVIDGIEAFAAYVTSTPARKHHSAIGTGVTRNAGRHGGERAG
jgi:acetyl esterase/lipase